MATAMDEMAALMAELAAGDPAALVALLDRHQHQLAAAVRRVATARGVWLPADEVDELVVDAALAVARVASAWSREGGALPWVWAHRQVAAVVDRHLGQFADPLDHRSLATTAEGPATAGAELPILELVATVAVDHPVVALLHEALERVASPRDRMVFLETAIQSSMGDRSPATTVGLLLGMAPASVRQQHRRVRLRVQDLAATEARYAPLAQLALVA